MAEAWVVTWLPSTMQTSIRHAPIRRIREQKQFDNQKAAVAFVMTLDEVTRRSAELHLPGGDVAYIESIEGMYAAQKASS